MRTLFGGMVALLLTAGTHNLPPAAAEERSLRAATAEIPADVPHIPEPDSDWVLATEGKGGAAPAFQFEVAYEGPGGDGTPPAGGRLIAARDHSWSGAMLTTWSGLPYVHVSKRGGGSRILLPEVRSGGVLLQVEKSSFKVRPLAFEDARPQFLLADGEPEVCLNLAEVLDNVLLQATNREFDAPTRTTHAEAGGFRSRVIQCDAFEQAYSGSPIESIQLDADGFRLTLRDIWINRRPPRAILANSHRIELPNERILSCDFDSASGKFNTERFERFWVTLPEMPYRKPALIEAPLALVESLHVNRMPPLDPAEIAAFRRSVQRAGEDDGEFEKVRAALDRVVIQPTIWMELEDFTVVRAEYRRSWAWNRLELAYGPVALLEFADAARDVISDGTVSVARRRAWLDLLGEIGFLLPSAASNDLASAVRRSRNNTLAVVWASVRARTSIPTRDESDRLLKAVLDESLPLDVRCIALESVCLRHRFTELDRDRLWALLPVVQGDAPKPLAQRVLMALLVDPAALQWCVEKHDGVMLKSMGPRGLEQFGIRVRAMGDDPFQEEGERVAERFLATVRTIAVDSTLDPEWRSAAAAESGWGEGGVEFARKFLPEAFRHETASMRRAALAVARDAGVLSDWLPQLEAAATSPDRTERLAAGLTLRAWTRNERSQTDAVSLWPVIDTCLRQSDVEVQDRALAAAWRLIRRGAAPPESTRKLCEALERSSPSEPIQCASLAVRAAYRNPRLAGTIPTENGAFTVVHRTGWWRENRTTLRKAVFDEP